MEPQRDMQTGDYQIDDQGKMVMTDSLGPAIRTRLRTHRNGWLYAPDAQYGSDFYEYKRRRSVQISDGLAESLTQRALAPMVNDGRMAELISETQFTQRGGVAIVSRFTDLKQRAPDNTETPIGE